MQIEIDDKLIERVKSVREYIKDKSPVHYESIDAELNALIEWAIERDEQELGLTTKEQAKDHNCGDNIKLDNEFDQVGDEMIFSGECSVCGKKVTQRFTYVDTRERKSDEVIDVCEKPFVEASAWRGMNSNTIIASIMAGLNVLREMGFGDDHQKKQLRMLIEEVVMLLSMLLKEKET